MKSETKLKLSQLGLSTLEVDSIEKLPALANAIEFIFDKEERNEKINKAVCSEYSLSTQIAILRKALVGVGCQDAEFVAFNNRVEEIKREIK